MNAYGRYAATLRTNPMMTGLCLALGITAGTVIAEDLGPTPASAKPRSVRRATIRVAPAIPKRGPTAKRIEPRDAPEQARAVTRPRPRPSVQDVIRRGPQIAGPRRNAFRGKPTPARPLPTKAKEQPAAEQVSPRVKEEVPGDRIAEQPVVARETPQEPAQDEHAGAPIRYHSSNRKPFGIRQSPTMMQSPSATLGHRLPQGFAARISSHAGGRRAMQAARELWLAEDPMKNLRPASPSMQVGPAVKHPKEAASEPKDEPVAKEVVPPLSAFIIVAPPAEADREASQLNEQTRVAPPQHLAPPTQTKRLTVSAEYRSAAIKPDRGPLDVPRTGATNVNQKPQWPASAFTSARWGGAADGPSATSRQQDLPARDREVGLTGGTRGVSADAREREPAAQQPAPLDQSSFHRSPATGSVYSPGVFEQDPRNRRGETRLVALHQSAAAQPRPYEELVAPDVNRSQEAIPVPAVEAPKSIRSIAASIEPPAGELPPNVAGSIFQEAGETFHGPGTTRDMGESIVMWEAPAVSHRQLFFEEPNLERHGYSIGVFQPVLSAAHFFARVPAIPYLAAADGVDHCQSTLGHYRPGSCAPYQMYLPPLSVKGLAVEATTVLGMLCLIP